MSMTPPVYTARDVPDLLASLPTLFGFAPAESLVAIATSGPRHRFGFRLRVDVPDAEHAEAVARLVVHHLRAQGAEDAVLVALTRRQDVAAVLLAEIEDRLGSIGCVVSVRADGERYWTSEGDCPPDGVAYRIPPDHPSLVHAIAAGQELLPDREALVDRYRAVSGPRREWLVAATGEVVADVLPRMADLKPLEAARVGIAAVRPILARALGGDRLADQDILRLAVWLSFAAVRDAVWVGIDRGNAPEMLRVLAFVARHVVPPFEPAVLSLAAFAAWLTGDGAQALIAAERALEADPAYPMAVLMMQVLEAGVSPVGWDGFEA